MAREIGGTEQVAAKIDYERAYEQLHAKLLLIHREIERHARSGILNDDERRRWRMLAARTKEALGL